MTLFRIPDTRDPLLLAAKLIVGFAMGMMIFAMVMVGIGLGAVATVQRTELLAKLAEIDAPSWVLWIVALALVLVLVALFLAVRFTMELYGIINSVGTEDPFQPENGARLNRMGWLALGAQAIGLVIGALATWLRPFAEKAGEELNAEFDFSFSGVLLVLILFILARVFRKGAAMREELEGTV
jgi:hypothetical protein